MGELAGAALELAASPGTPLASLVGNTMNYSTLIVIIMLASMVSAIALNVRRASSRARARVLKRRAVFAARA